jgi:soluble lytic murein transglycosylase-like protein
LKKRLIPIAALIAVILIVVIAFVVASRQRVARRRVFRAAPAETKAKAPSAELRPVEEWSEQFRYLCAAERWGDLDALLDRIEAQHPDLYVQNSLAYLHARARIENNDRSGAAKKLAPYLAAGNPYRDLALYHQAELDDANDDHAAASAHRTELIAGAPNALYREEALDDETEWRASLKDPKPLLELTSRVYASAPTARRRDLDAHIVEALVRNGDMNNALTRGLTLLRGGTTDDPSDRVSRALDRPELLRRMNAQQWAMLGESFRNHRHYDRAVAVLSLALGGPPPQPAHAAMLAVKKKVPVKPKAKPKPAAPVVHASAGPDRNDLLFSIGRSWFGAEQYANARQTYLRGANETHDMRWKSTFLWHAARAAQLQNDDAAAEQLMTQSIAVPGRFPSTAAALTQRLRTRLKQKRVAEAAADLNAIRAGWPRDHAIVEASLAWAIYMIAANNDGAALGALNAVPPALLDKYDGPELAYWRARALERSNPHAAFETYLTVLRAPVPTHFAYFARTRLQAPAMASRVVQELASREQQAAQLVAAKKLEEARHVETDRILLSSRNRDAELKRLTSIYEQLPPYRTILELAPLATPQFPLAPNADRASRLMAMGLFDEAIDDIPRRYPLQPARAALTQSLALNRGAASKQSIYAIEVLMNAVPRDYLPELLPMSVRELLYPRYFYGFITEDAKKYEADPTLVLSIMREESRFNPRAKSEAAARGLLQFIITTARDIGRDVGLVDVQPEDLYDPRVIIRLGAKYIAELTKQFSGDRYKAAAAYNAGPKQTELWARLAPAAGEDFFLSSINFDETKQYVRKVMNSYARYGEIYGGSGPVGGVRAEP